MALMRDTTQDERMTWGECPVCGVQHGNWCHAEVGAQLGVPVGGGRMQTGSGVHLARIRNAPMRVKLVSADNDPLPHAKEDAKV